MLEKGSRILVTGHRGLVGSAVVRRLKGSGFESVLNADRNAVDLRDSRGVDQWFDDNRPEFVFHVAGRVGGIWANSTQPADFLYDNLMMHATVLRAAWRTGVTKLLYLGSSCIYPRDCPQPIKEESLLTGPLEKTNDAYAIAKISGLMSCEAYRRQHGCNFISAMPTNLYGQNDNFHPEQSHVLPGLMRRFDEARKSGAESVTIWGSGSPRREFLHVDDLADACVFLMEHYNEPGTINVGTGVDVTIRELAETIRDVVYPEVKLTFDTSKPDGTPRKLLDVSRLEALGWRYRTSLKEGVRSTYDWYRSNQASLRAH
ncbi:GDP-L-fucose synthase [Caulifigura coniformis]|uniref:GDP-L-fucose synthase n=1 Tax=Caulifigura coniformis TaxID=2527983 RepID=A0A517SIB2_9PLAN|nr:GDP-L-fucose synthase [Caulifigura coniformis]QDT55860.1 GDP-L-fucose synthase [Caulifigura coniformis]